MSNQDIAIWIGLGLTVAGNIAFAVWFMSRMQSAVEGIKEDLADIKELPDRVLTLEHSYMQLHRDHEATRQEIRQLRDRHHEFANTLNAMNLKLELVVQFINDMKERRKAERQGE